MESSPPEGIRAGPAGGTSSYPVRVTTRLPRHGYRRGMRSAVTPSWGNVLLALVLTALTLATLAAQGTGPSATAVVLSVLTAAPLAWRQQAPVATTAVILLALAAYNVLGLGEFPNNGIGMFVALFTVATSRSRAQTAAVFAACLVVTVLTYANSSTPVVWPQAAQAALTVLGAWMLGEATRRWAERAERAAAEAAEAVAQERVRIARELHDIVAHHMSVISLQAGVAEYVIDEDPATAKAAITTVGTTGREALVDLRRLLDVLRLEDPDEDQYSPQPGMADLDRLVAHAGVAGLRVETTLSGTVRALPPGLDLCCYRTVQEALTNVVKHAGAAEAAVAIEYAASCVRLRVSDDGSGARPGRTRESHGIRGMRERAAIYGGELVAGPRATGGFEVSLRLPTGLPT